VQQITITRPPVARATPWRLAARWLITFAGFPLGGVAARYLTGPVDGTSAAVLGGLVTGAVLGAVQAWGLRTDRTTALRWTLATSVGLAVGLGLGATAVAFATSPDALVGQGALSGVAVGVAQAFVVRSRLGRAVLAWPAALGAIWAAGWAVTSAVGVQVGEQFTVFGSSGALVVTLLTVVLPLRLHRAEGRVS
jgi:hypothetical protein